MAIRSLSRWLTALSLAGISALPALAETVTFEDVSPPTQFSSSSITSGNFTFTSDGFGFSGVDNASAFSAFGNAPAGTTGQFLYMLNTDGIEVTRTGGGEFFLEAFDAGFIAPIGGLGPNILAGQLWVLASDAIGGLFVDIFEFPASNAAGDFEMTTFRTVDMKGQPLVSASFFACVYDASFLCDFSDRQLVLPQFALDNLNLPEPGSAALALAAFGLLAVRRSRRAVPVAA